MTSTSKMVSAFEGRVKELEALAGGPVHLIRMIGPRSSFVAGRVDKDMPFVEIRRVKLDDEWVLFFYAAPGRAIDPGLIKTMFRETIQ